MKTALLIAYHYPPVGVSSGVHRTLAFSRELPRLGWRPVVLTAHPRAYTALRDDQVEQIPDEAVVIRAFAADTARHLAISGRYLSWMALPDRWVSWWLGGVWSGLQAIRKFRPDVIWSTYPIATAHLIGLTLQRLSGLPWVADFRDSMTEENYPRDPKTRRAFLGIERSTIRRCSAAVFTTPSARRMYLERYPWRAADDLHVVENGYDEESFARAAALPSRSASDGARTLVHSGVLYPEERDPRPFFRALAQLKDSGRVSAASLRVVLRGSGHDARYAPVLEELGIDDVVHLEPAIAYRHALREMMDADGLLLFQAASCNHQIPAKVYEYLRAGRPILAFTDEDGDTARLLEGKALATTVPMDNEQSIQDAIAAFLSAPTAHPSAAESAFDDAVSVHSRVARCREMTRLLEASLA